MNNTYLVNQLVKNNYVKTPRIVKAFQDVNRGFFVLEEREAYNDHPLVIPSGQTISAPHMVAIMLELLDLQREDSVLEIGAGSGYNAALLGKLAKHVVSMERDEELVSFATKNLKKAGITNVDVIHGDGSKGFPSKKPYNKIVFTCAVGKIPPAVLKQLKNPGILIAPVGKEYQELVLLRKDGRITTENHGGVVFVPLR